MAHIYDEVKEVLERHLLILDEDEKEEVVFFLHELLSVKSQKLNNPAYQKCIKSAIIQDRFRSGSIRHIG